MQVVVGRGSKRHTFEAMSGGKLEGIPAARAQTIIREREQNAEDLKAFIFRPKTLGVGKPQK